MIVNAVRSDQSLDSFAKLSTTRASYRIFNFLSGHQIPIDVGGYHLLNRKIEADVLGIGEKPRLSKGNFS